MTAQHRKERLQDTPVAVTALSADALALRGISDVTQIAGTVPGLVIPTSVGAGTSTNFYMRGVGQFDNYATVDPGVGVYLDGVYIGRSQAGIFDIANVERIEVLRGPQGTLYGKNTIGGLVNIITSKPGPDFSADVRLRGGSRNLLGGMAAINLPLVEDKLFASFSVNASTQDGYVRSAIDPQLANPFGDAPGRFGDKQDISARAAIRYRPNSDLDINLSADMIHRRGTAVAFIARDGSLADGIDPVYATTSNRRTSAGYRAPEENDGKGLALHVDYTFGDITVQSITSYRDSSMLSGGDYDGTPSQFLDQRMALDQNQFSQEIRFSGTSFDDRLKWIGGLFYFHEKFDQEINIYGSEGTLYGLDVDQYISGSTESYAAFLQGTFSVSDTLSVTAGGRYTEDKKDGSVFWTPYYDIFFGSGPVNSRGKWGAFTPHASIEWKMTPDALLYASYTRGFRSGGINGRAGSPASAGTYGPEKLDGFEGGLKSDLFGKRLRANIAAYYNLYKDIQLIAVDTSGTSFPTVNGGEAEVYGAEVELEAQITSQLNVSANYAYTHAQYTDLIPAVTMFSPTLKAGNRLPNAPRHTFSIAGNYVQPVGNAGSELRLHAEYRYRGFVYPFSENEFKNAGYGILDGRVTFAADADRWQLSAYCLNCANKKYIIWGQYRVNTFGFEAVIPGLPRELGLELRAKF
ncbi:outer membrane receptor protein [Novosphingobium sp. AP12]|nr:outer membrane receptor protein [Novosphingobium sp. AP12]